MSANNTQQNNTSYSTSANAVLTK